MVVAAAFERVAVAAAVAEGGSGSGGWHHHLSKYRKKGENVILKTKMSQCPICYQSLVVQRFSKFFLHNIQYTKYWLYQHNLICFAHVQT